MAIRVTEGIEMTLRKKSPHPKKLSGPVTNFASGYVFRVDFIRKAISTISFTRMAMKPYIIRKEIE